MDETKKILRSLLVSSPMVLTVTELNDDYREVMGYEIPYKDLGYETLLDFLKEIPDILKVNGNSLKSEISLVVSEKTAHVNDMVLKQKKGKGKYGFESNRRKVSNGQALCRLTQKLNLVNGPSYALPPLDTTLDKQLFPKDAIGCDVEIKRDFVSQSEVESDIFRVVVAEIYDPSKFWLFRDDGKLDALKDEMQPFYNTNKERYRIPEQFLEIGLYCAAVVLEEFHRCVIVKMIPDFSFVHVFYIDYGTLGTVPKNEVWFLKRDFAGLPAQAIRARLANICPPIEFAMWTSEARGRFQQLADMKHLEAKITKVSREKKIIEVCVENHKAAPGRDIGSILVDEGYAVYANQVRGMNIYDSNCTPRVKFVHLFPDFEEIEYWLAPSIEEMAWFSNTDLTADFYFPQYFSRSIDKSLHDNIEIEAKKLLKKNEKPIKEIDIKDLETFGNMQDVSKVQYGDLYEKYKDKVNDYGQYFKSINKPSGVDYLEVVRLMRTKLISRFVPQATQLEG